MRAILAVCSILALSSCGGGRVTGEIGQACMAAGRSAANPALCSCVQRAADMKLSAREQARAAEFFEDPQKAQDTRQASNGDRYDFWDRYREFVDTAEALCAGT